MDNLTNNLYIPESALVTRPQILLPSPQPIILDTRSLVVPVSKDAGCSDILDTSSIARIPVNSADQQMQLLIPPFLGLDPQSQSTPPSSFLGNDICLEHTTPLIYPRNYEEFLTRFLALSDEDIETYGIEFI